MAAPHTSHQLFWFIFTGASAALVHLSVVALCVERFELKPSIANMIGFAVAFWVSFAGHFLLTFRGSGAQWTHAAARFAVVAVTAFAVNQLAYTLLLKRVPHDWYLPLLAAVLVAVAVGTFTVSRLWAFAHPGANDNRQPRK